jgi:hypothetical protein
MSDTELLVADPLIEAPAPEPVETTKPERELSPRERAMERILAHRQEVMDAEVGVAAEIAAQSPAVIEDEPEPREVEPEPVVERPRQVAAPVAPEPVQRAPEPVWHDVQVPGHGVMRVSQDQLFQLAQMGALANVTMHQHSQQAAPEPVRQAEPAPLVDDETARNFARRLSYGDESEQTRAVQELVAAVVGRTQPAIDQNAIVNAAVARSIAAQTFTNNMVTIGNEYPDIFGKAGETDPAAIARNHRLAEVAARELTDLRQREAMLGRQRPDLELYREAANNVRRMFGTQAPQSVVETDTSPALQAAAQTSQRLERKRAAPRVPTAASRAASLGQEQPRGMSRSDVVALMRKQRGQVSMQ